MTLKSKHTLFEEWDFPDGRYVLTKHLADDRLLFRSLALSREEILSQEQLEAMLCAGEATRIRRSLDRTGRPNRYDQADEVGPDGASDEARARRFYTRKFDQQACSLSAKALSAFVEDHAAEAARRGIVWKPSSSALYRAITERGVTDNRPLKVMESQSGKGKRNRWPPAVAEILERAVGWYYSLWTRDKGDAYAWLRAFVLRTNRLGRARYGTTWRDLPTPSYETLRVRINEAECEETLAAKFNGQVGRRRFRGVRPTIQAKAILDFVLIDSTVVDGWCVLDDQLDDLIPAGRPTLTFAMDLYSRTVLAAVLTYEPPSIYTIMSCVQLVTTPKLDLMRQWPEFAELWRDKHGKPDSIIVDNALEQIGVSFQDACEDASINVLWAPVKNPEYKAPIERLFGTFNKKLFHKLAGGVPLPPHMMKQMGFDPARDATTTRTMLEGLVYQTLRDSYQYEVHAGIEAAPETLWRRGLAQGRETIDDVNFLASAFGAVDTAMLTREGITFEGMRFHDPVTTSKLLEDLAHLTPHRKRRKGGATATVKIKYNPADVSRISVWNPEAKPRKKYEILPNLDVRYVRGGLGMWHHKQLKDWAKAEDLPFSTDDERWAARHRLRASIEAAAPSAKFAAMRRKRRLLEAPKPVLAGDLVRHGTVVPGALAAKPADIPTVPLAFEREGDGIPEKGPRRGGKKAMRTAAETRKRKEAEREAQASSQVSKATKARPDVSGFALDDADAYAQDFERRMAERNRKKD
ncbi:MULTISPECIES: DDE-type integrase/transposase/recombinase [unclassified Methylobacterium]|jgi:putative transposase|uniref:DDE-type integrase/transposase/recombinase n=1 Tax=unclassified Methylobacterium TaxID=2615210 RepID=UPI00136EE4B2|nr:DDE-type integrase/transposase/recombinase [Methylobacterium sp. 2A]